MKAYACCQTPLSVFNIVHTSSSFPISLLFLDHSRLRECSTQAMSPVDNPQVWSKSSRRFPLKARDATRTGAVSESQGLNPGHACNLQIIRIGLCLGSSAKLWLHPVHAKALPITHFAPTALIDIQTVSGTACKPGIGNHHRSA